MSRHTKQQYEDVARLLFPYTANGPSNEERHGSRAARLIAVDFADLFAADNPPSTRCLHCGDPRPSKSHRFGGFDRERFLAACGWKETPNVCTWMRARTYP